MRRTIVRVSAVAAIVGAALALVGNLVHPRGGDDPDFEVYKRFAHSTSLRIADLMLIVALMLLTVAVVGIARSLEGDDVEVFARLGVLFGVVGGTIAIAEFGLESYAYRLQAQVFEGARGPDIRSAFWAANAVDHVNNGLFITWTLVFLGIAPFVIGLGMVRSAQWPTWIGVLGALGGAVCAVVAAILFVQTDAGSQDVAFLVGSLLVTAWFFCAGVWLLRSPTGEAAPA
jgi:hypothetical protein